MSEGRAQDEFITTTELEIISSSRVDPCTALIAKVLFLITPKQTEFYGGKAFSSALHNRCEHFHETRGFVQALSRVDSTPFGPTMES